MISKGMLKLVERMREAIRRKRLVLGEDAKSRDTLHPRERQIEQTPIGRTDVSTGFQHDGAYIKQLHKTRPVIPPPSFLIPPLSFSRGFRTSDHHYTFPADSARGARGGWVRASSVRRPRVSITFTPSKIVPKSKLKKVEEADMPEYRVIR